MTPRPRTVILGKGNLLLKDEGVGVHVIETLKSDPRFSDGSLEIVDGGTLPDLSGCLEDINGIDKLIIIDAVQSGNAAGTIFRFNPDEVEMPVMYYDSLHQIDLKESLRLMEAIGLKPKQVVVLGIEAGEIDWGLELSPEVKNKIPKVIELILKEAQIAAHCKN